MAAGASSSSRLFGAGLAGAPADKGGADKLFDDVERKAVKIGKFNAAVLDVDVLDLVFEILDDVSLGQIEDKRLFMGFDGKERPVEFIKGESEAHAFTNASGRAANHAADSRHSNAPVVGKALQIASDRRSGRNHE